MARNHGAVGPVRSKPIIFFLDDNDAVRDSMHVLLEAEGYQTIVFEIVATFLNGLAVAENPPDCVIEDVELPDGDGCEVAAQIADQRPRVPVILISGKDVKALHEQAIAVGAFAFFDSTSAHCSTPLHALLGFDRDTYYA